ncbi:MAG: TonB-dependent receptor [Novosphingobium sp.]|nr:TonB-dependent receptor [Novosphingobium sp.]
MGYKSKLLISSAMILAGFALPGTAWAEDAAPQPANVDEIVVTAGRRAQSLSDVPSNISAVTGDMLEKAGVSDVNSLTRLVPGVVMLDEGPRASGNRNTLIIRGLNANAMNPNDDNPSNTQEAVSTYFGETPVFFPLKLIDVDRIELLRGPQGTLYGSGSVGGTLRIIPKAPDLSHFSAEVNAEGSLTAHSGDPSYDLWAMVNVPVSPTLGLRMSGGYQYFGGFIDALGLVQMDGTDKFHPGAPVLADPSDPLTSPAATKAPEKDVNNGYTAHFRAAMLFEPSDSFNATLRYTFQHTLVNDRYEENPYYGTGEHYVHYKDNLDPQESDIHIASLDVNVDVGFAQMTSATSYSQAHAKSSSDSSPFLRVNIPQYYFGFPRLISPIYREQTRKVFTQELRLVSKPGGAFDWIVGAYYNRNHLDFSMDQRMPGLSDYVNALYGLNPPIDFSDVLAYGGQNKVTQEGALYGELTWHPTDKLSLTGGLRAFKLKTTGTSGIPLPFASRTTSWYYGIPLDDFLLGGIEPLSYKDSGVIFRANVAYDITPHTLLYATFAQGYRGGGSNALPLTDPSGNDNSGLLQYDPDKVNSYEVGLKGDVGRLSYSATGFWIDWSDMQQQLVSQLGVSYIGNVPGARSRGVELSLAGSLTDRLSMALGYTYTDAEVTESFLLNASRPATEVHPGAPLPGSSKHMATASFDYDAPLSDSLGLKLHGDLSYRSPSQSTFQDIDIIVGGVDTFTGDNFIRFPSATVLNLSATLEFDSYSLTLFANNVTSELGTNSGNAAEYYGAKSQSYGVLRPRTIGLRANFKFGN